MVRVSDRTLALVLHLAAGIVVVVVVVVVGLEPMPEPLGASCPWVPILAFVGGEAFFMGIERANESIRRRLGKGAESGGASAIFTGVSLDLYSDGVMIGNVTVLNPSLGLLLALGQVPTDVPEGFAAIATLRRARIARSPGIWWPWASPHPSWSGPPWDISRCVKPRKFRPCPCSH